MRLLIHIDNRDGKECHVINADYQTAVFRDRAEAELLIDRLEFIFGQIVSGGAGRIGEIDSLSDFAVSLFGLPSFGPDNLIPCVWQNDRLSLVRYI